MKKQWVGPQEICPRCGSLVGSYGDQLEYLADHTGANGRKCPERAKPVSRRAKKKRSIRALGGGLPGLGKR